MVFQWLFSFFEGIKENLRYHQIHLQILCLHLQCLIHLHRLLILSQNFRFGDPQGLLLQNLLLNLLHFDFQNPFLVPPFLQDHQDPHLLNFLNPDLNFPLLTIHLQTHFDFLELQVPLHLQGSLPHRYLPD